AILGEGNSFTLDPDSYAIGDIRVWQKDLAGNASEIYSNAHAITITTDISGTTTDGGSGASTVPEVSSAHGFTINTGTSWNTIYPRSQGQAVSSAGDVNGDGIDDLIVGLASQYYKWGWKTGKSYVVFGKVDGEGVDVNNLGSGGFTIIGRAGNSLSGYAVSSAGDVNGDGLDDLIIGAPKEWHTWGIKRSGTAYVVFGKTDTSSVLLKDVYNGTGGFAIKGYIYESYAGASVSAAGDINNDGLDDVIVDTNSDGIGDIIASAEYQKFAIFGKKSTSSVSLSAIANGTADDQGFVINSDNLCPPVTSSADFNGDGFIDSI
ncbi:Flagellar hook-length control protein FliK, partial [Bathymodiolus thermophilus thioautotrophic gill symbiont]